jgi:hypothetical protein
MRTETITRNLYKFDELSDDAKDKAIEKLWDINVDYDWWQWTYDDAEEIGLKLTGFDLDRGSYCKGEFIDAAEYTAKRIIKNHGDTCETYKDAQNYLKELEIAIAKNLEENADCDYPEDYLDTEEIDDEFLRNLLEDYRIMLQKEWDYLTSREAIIETIESNDYEFDEDGNLA